MNKIYNILVPAVTSLLIGCMGDVPPSSMFAGDTLTDTSSNETNSHKEDSSDKNDSNLKSQQDSFHLDAVIDIEENDITEGKDGEEDIYAFKDVQDSANTEVNKDSMNNKDTYSLKPTSKDKNCLILFNFDDPTSKVDLCSGYTATAYETKNVPSMQGFGEAIYTNGKAYFELKDTAKLNPTDSLTLEALIKPNPNKSWEGDFGNIIAKAEGSVTDFSGYNLWIGKDYVAGSVSVNGIQKSVQIPYTLPTNKFTHLALTYDGNKVKLFVNKKNEGELSATGKVSYTKPKNLFIGWNYCCSNGFIGKIDEVRISDIARKF